MSIARRWCNFMARMIPMRRVFNANDIGVLHMVKDYH